MTRETFYDRIWGYDFGGEIEHSGSLHPLFAGQSWRRPAARDCIQTVRGVGYVLREPAG